MTVALTKEAPRQLRVLAAKRGTSVSALLKERLEPALKEERDYE